MVQVLLDDGDRRQVDVASVRMLPQDYSHVGKFNLEVAVAPWQRHAQKLNKIGMVCYAAKLQMKS